MNGSTSFGYIYGSNYKDVKNRLIQKKSELMKCSQSTACTISLEEWAVHWLKLKLGCRVKQTTAQTYNMLLKNHILPILGVYNLGNISVDKVIELITQMKSKEYSMSTISFVFRLLNTILNDAVEFKLIKDNPCKHVKTIKNYHTREQHVLSKEEQEKLEKTNDLSILLALYTGMRIGELCGLKWSDIDWDVKTISVCRTIQRVRQKDGKTKLVENSPKTESSFRIIPLSDKLQERLKVMSIGSNEYILGKNGRPCDPRVLQRKLKAITVNNGINDIHFHSLRHTFATRMVAAGADMKTVSMLLGHSTVNTTLNIYTHSCMDLKKEAIKKLTEQNY